MGHALQTEIVIDADPQTVWSVLTDLDAYRQWNPFVVESTGRVAEGERLVNRLEPPGGKAMTFKPTVTEVKDLRAFEWLGRLGVPGVFDGRHRFELEATGDGTILRHSEHFTGVLVPFMKRSLDRSTKAGLEAMNQALKDRAEARVGGGS